MDHFGIKDAFDIAIVALPDTGTQTFGVNS